MPRNRSISPDLLTDERLLPLPLQAKYLYLGAISQADDEGRLPWSARQLHARVIADPEVPIADVENWMAAMRRHVRRLSTFILTTRVDYTLRTATGARTNMLTAPQLPSYHLCHMNGLIAEPYLSPP